MVRRFSWCTVVALVVLLFVATEGLRERSTQVDDQKTLTTRDRGALRFNARSPEEATTSLPFARSKSSRDRSPQSRTPLQERHDDGTSNTETRYESSKRSNFRSKTAERNVSGDATNSSRRNLSKSIDEVRKGEPVINRRSGKRYSTENSEITSMKEEQSVTSNPLRDSTKRPSTRTAHYEVTERLIDNSGPSVFTATTESSRSRTGRKIQTTFASRDFKTQIPASRRFTNKDAEDAETSTASLRRSESRRSTTERIERGTRSGRSKLSNKESNSITRKTQDAILSESESVRVDVPLTVDSTASPNSESSAVFGSVSQPTTTIPQIGKRSDTKESRAGSRRGTERPKGRGRSTTSDSVAPTSRSSRRGPSKFNDLGTTEAGEQNAAWKKNTISRDRSRGPEVKKERARSRNRNFENAVTPSTYDAKRKATGERNFTERRARVSESTTRSVEHRGQDQDGRRGRNRSRVNATTPAASDITSTASPETTVVTEVLTTSTDSESSQSPSSTTPSPSTSTTANPRTLTTTPRSSSTTEGRNRGRARPGQGRVQPKEDFFNHGLGFRGRKPSTEAPPGTNDTRRPTAPRNDSQSHGNPGWTLRRRPSNANGSEVAPRTVVPSVRDQTNEVIPTSEQSTSTDIITTIESSTRRAFKKPQSSTEVSTAVDGSTTKSPRRGNKSFGFGRSSAESEESDNYPPDFKARLSQLKITNMKSTAPKTVPRPSLEDPQTSVFGRRSRTKSRLIESDDLDTSAAGNRFFTDQSFLEHPLTLINARGLRRVKKSASTTALFAERSRLKLDLARRLVKPELNIEENDLDATTASSSFSKPKPIPKPTDETSKVPEFPKPSLPGRRGSTESSQEDDKSSKLSRPRKYPEDPAKIPSRPTGTKKGKIIAERMVTSISVEERVEETTKSFVATVSTEETAAATTLDPIKVRLSNRGSKRPKEEGTTIQKHAKLPARSNDSVTTFKPKKGYSYQARNRKTQDQATPEPISDATTSNKSSKLASRRRPSEEDKEETISKKSKYIETATKPTFRPRYSKGGKDRSTVEKTEYQATTKLPVATSRYSRKKAAVKTTESKVKGTSTEGPVNHTKKLEFRPRTATYRRHSDVPTTVVESTTKIETTGVAITPRSPKYTPTLSTSTTPAPPVSQEPQLNLMIANDTQQVNDTGITGSSNGDSGNTNVFNPTRTAFITANNASLLEQLRSTVAPLLNSLGNKSPVFSSAYSNVNYANSGPRITPSGSPPRFSARYKGAELFVRKQNNVYQPTVPSITSSSTTPVTPVENSGSAPPVEVSSPGEPRFLTLYQALESASIRNEQLQGVQQPVQVNGVPQVDVRVANEPVDNATGNIPNNDTTSPAVSTTTGPQTPDTTTIRDSTLSPRLGEETTSSTTPAATTAAPESLSTTEQPSTASEPPSSTEQASTSTVPSSSTDQTNTEPSSTTEQVPISTESSTMSTQSEQPTTELSSTTMEPSSAATPLSDRVLARILGNIASSRPLGGPTTAAYLAQSPSTELYGRVPTTLPTESPSTTETATVPSTTIATTTTESTTVASTTSENPETNTIQLSETTSTQASTTDTSTTEADSNNLIDVETTTATIAVTTIRNRLIDFAQDILSRLQATLNTTTVPPQDATTTIPPATEISNVILDSGSRKNSLEVLAQLRDNESTTTQVTGQPEPSTTVGSVNTQAAGAQDQTDPVTTPNPTTTTQDPQTTVSDDSGSPETTTQVVSSTSDTLLTELMSIAKTLLSEHTNETGQFVQNDTAQAAEPTSIAPDNSTETPESTTTTATPELTTLSVDPSQNEVDPAESTTALPAESSSELPTTTLSSNEPDSEAETVPTNQTLGSRAENIIESTTQTTVTSDATGIELTTNAYDSTTRPGSIATTETQTPPGPVTEVASTESVAPLTGSSTTQPPGVDANTNQPEITATVTVPETILSRVNTVTSTPATPSTSPESSTEQTTVADAMSTTPLNVNPMDVAEATTTTNQQQTPLTSTTMASTEVTTNTPEQTTNLSQTTPSLENETPTVARFQDTTSATAQGTAGSGIGQTTEITPTTTFSVLSSPESSSSSSPSSTVTTASASTVTSTTETSTTTESRTTTTMSGRTEVFTVTPMTETTVTTVDINENLLSTEATPGTIAIPAGSTNGIANGAPGNGSVAIGARISELSGGAMPAASPTVPYLGRFGASRMTPAPRFSPSSTTRAPLRDYLIYGIYPNKTIVRKRPEDNLIDARNVDSPYVIFGIFPDGSLVRKFPNGTIIPDPPRNPVEVVFSLSTSTTTNRPPPRPYYNQANQGAYNRYQGPVYSNNRRPEPMGNVQSPGTVDLGLTGNAIVGPDGGGPDLTGPLGTPPASVPTANEMGNTPLNTQMGTTSGAMSANAGRLTPIVSTGRPPTDSQGGRIVQDRERDEATRTKEAGGQRSSVYIGQDKFVNYWTDQASTANPRVVSVNINSVATAKNQGPSVAVPSFNNLLNNEPSGRVTAPPGFPWRDPLDQILGITTSSPVITASVASNMLDDSSDSLPARPINPFVEIFTPFRSAIANFVSSTLAPARMSTTTMPTGTAATTTSALPTTTPRTTTPPTTTTTTTTTTTMAPTTTRPLPTITFPPVTNTIARVTITPAPTGTPNSNFVTPPFNLQTNLLPNVQQQNTFGSTFDDLAFLNSLLQSNTRSSTTPKTLTQVEQLLANKILSLALNNPGPTRAPKAIKVENASPNSVTSLLKSSPGPIVIDLLPSSTAGTPTWKPVPTQEQLQKDTPLNNNLFDQTTRGPISSTTVKSAAELNKATANLISTTKAPVTIAAKTAATTPRPKTTTQAPFGLGASLWQALFGGGLFGPSTTPRPVKSKPAKTIEVAQSVSITPKPVPTTQKPQTVQTAAPTTLRSVDISKIEVSTPNSIFTEAKSVTTPSSISTTKLSVATSPKPRSVKETSTFSPEEDAKFLVELLRAVQNDNKASASKKPSAPKQDDESFLRAILSGRAFTTTTAAPSNEISDSALLAALLKAQGIEPPTPATKIREQLLLASIDQGVSLAPTASATTVSTTVATEQASATRPTDTTKKTVTPRPTSRPRIRTTTWSPSSTYPPPLFSSFSNYGIPGQSAAVGDNSGSGALFGATRAFSQLLGAAISGAAQQLQSLVRNGTRIVSEAVG